MRKTYTAFGVICLCLLANSYLAGQTREPASSIKGFQNNAPKDLLPQGQWFFQENKGQLRDQSKQPLPDVLYYGQQGNVSVYLRKQKISFVFLSLTADPSESAAIYDSLLIGPGKWKLRKKPLNSVSRMDMILEGANSSASVSAENQQDFYINTYAVNAPEGIRNIRTFKRVIYHGIYKGIDLVLYCTDRGIKYEFVVRPGGNVADIRLKWEGAKEIRKDEKGGVIYKNAIAELKESRPRSYTVDGVVQSAFVLAGNTVQFSVGNVPKGKVLTIDPSLDWGTFFGGSDDEYYVNFRDGIAIDKGNNVYMSGTTQSTSGIATSGSFQSSFSGSTSNGMLAKFNAAGKLKWATYFGDEVVDGCEAAMDVTGSVYVCGQTKNDNIGTSGTYQQHVSGDWDAFVAKFDSTGGLAWGTYFGSYNTDYGLTLTADDTGNVYIGGYTGSTGLATTGAFRTTPGQGYLAKFSPKGALRWATYTSGFVDGITIDRSGNIIFTQRGPETGMATSGAYQTTGGGGNVDGLGLLSSFTPAGKRNWATYFNCILLGQFTGFKTSPAVDKENSIYVACTIDSITNPYVTTPVNYGVLDGWDAMLYKFKNDGSELRWGVVYGSYGSGENRETPGGIAIDTCGFIYMTGGSSNSFGITTPTAYQSSCNGCAFLSRFSPSGKLAYGTYTVSRTNWASMGVQVDRKNNVVITGTTYGSASYLVKNAYQSSSAGGIDRFVQKFTSGQTAAVSAISDKKVLCPDDTVSIGSKKVKGIVYEWTSNPRGFYSDSANPIAKPRVTTVYYRNAYPADGCAMRDSMKVTVLNPFIPMNKKERDTICLGDSTFIGGKAITGHTYSWSSKPAGFSSFLSNPKVSPKISTWYYVKEKNGNTGCTITDSVYVFLDMPSLDLEDYKVCRGKSMKITNPPTPGHTYSWTSKPAGFTSTLPDPVVKPDSTTIYYLTETSSTGCTMSDSLIMTVLSVPKPYAGKDRNICRGATDTLRFKREPGHGYSWQSNPSGLFSQDTVVPVKPMVTTRYYLYDTLKATGCIVIDTVTLTVVPLPLVYPLDSQSICRGDSVLIFVNPNKVDYKYSWTSNPPGFTASRNAVYVKPDVTTVYTVAVTNENGCTGTGSVTVTIKKGPTPYAGSDKRICLGNSVALGTSAAGTTYEWTSEPAGFSSTDPVITVSPSVTTTYYFKQKLLSTGCSWIDTVKVTVIPKLTPKAGENQSLCEGDSLRLHHEPVAGYKFEWFSSRGDLYSTDTSLWVKPVGKTIYYLKQTDSVAGCTGTGQFTVTINPIPKPQSGGNHTICPGDAIFLGRQPIPGSRYSWSSNPPGFSSTAANILVTPVQKTTYYVTETTGAGCSGMDSAVIDFYPLPDRSDISAPTEICLGENYVLRYRAENGYSYKWSSEPPGFSSGDTEVTVTPGGTTIYILQKTSPVTGCSRYDSVIVIVPPLPDARILGDKTVCGVDDRSYFASARPGNTYQWKVVGGYIISGQGTDEVKIHWNNIGVDSVFLIVKNARGCSNSGALPVNVFPRAEADFRFTDGCENEAIQFEDTTRGSETREWHFGDGGKDTDRVAHHSYTKAGTYSVFLVTRTVNGCTDTVEKDITIYPAPKLNLVIKPDGERSYVFGVSDILYAKYKWDFGDGSQSIQAFNKHAFGKDGNYPISLSVTSNKGCVTRLDTMLKVNTPPARDSVIVFPNPAKDKVTVRVFLSKDAHIQANVSDELGRIMASGLIDSYKSAGVYDFVLENQLSALAPALYVFDIQLNGRSYIRKVVKLSN